MGRITKKLEQTKSERRAALITYIMAGDPNLEDTSKILTTLAQSSVDMIELGMPFTDPVADGPVIQLAGERALKSNVTIDKIFDLVKKFRQDYSDIPIILMGYYNPVFYYGIDAFLKQSKDAGVDGFIIVDLPLEEKEQMQIPAQKLGLDFISLITPATPNHRIKRINENASGFLYYVSVSGVTGTKSAKKDELEAAVQRVKENSQLPIAIGFGINNPFKVQQAGSLADAVVVGTAIVEKIAEAENKPIDAVLGDVKSFVTSLSVALKQV